MDRFSYREYTDMLLGKLDVMEEQLNENACMKRDILIIIILIIPFLHTFMIIFEKVAT